ncbi:MAG TPA: HWE histidine kinase domain-containing protein [Rubellimicrobium sp.]|nr:HWE histidine kinase domain-containing protein [Rubellimicrobium sp.]
MSNSHQPGPTGQLPEVSPADRDLLSNLDRVLITDELGRRPSRPPDHALENRALSALAHELATSSGTVLDKLVHLMVDEGLARSAGISILEPGEASSIFRWVAVAGFWAEHVGGTMPFGGSPCGAVVSRNQPLLFARPHEHFPAAHVEPLIHEILLVPFQVHGEPRGTVWAISHSPERRFDAEDLRLLTGLARFASAAYQMNAALDEAQSARQELERRVEERTRDLRTTGEALRESERQARLLLIELQHRVRNTLAVIRSIARRTAATSETAEDYAMHLEGRIDAFARVQSAVTHNLTAGLDLEMLVADSLLAVRAQEGARVLSISGPKARLQPKAAETVALALHELATNAVKYGALLTESGRIRVNWSLEGDGRPRLVLKWIETGVELSDEGPKRQGFGTELLERTLAYELEGEAHLRFEPDGLRCVISLPISDEIFVRSDETLADEI